MIISQIMLTGILVQWLRSQWLDRKESLQKDINVRFQESVSQVMDSVLVKHLIQPVMNNSYERGAGPDRSAENSGSFKSMHEGSVSFNTYDSIRKSFILKSVRLIIDQADDSTGRWRQISHTQLMVPDTILLKSVFKNNLGKLNPGFNTRLIFGTEKVIRDKKEPVLFVESNFFGKPAYAEVMHYQKAVLFSISPQIVFAIILLSFTGAAFVFAYRNLKKMETLNILRNDFISNISHELRTPVSTITVALEALKDSDRMKDPAKSNEYLEIAFNEMKRLDKLITQILDTSVLDDKNQYLQVEETDLVSLTKEVLNSMQARFSLQEAKVEFKTGLTTCILRIDRLHIEGVLVNLLDNSLKYTTGVPEISVRIEEWKNRVLLTVRDNGPGIPEKYIRKVFDKFFRVPKGDTHDVKGYGLGLSFADQVMKHHSGSISVRNLKEGGCIFTLEFPGTKR